MFPRLTLLGAAGTVTGSCYLLEHGSHRLLVDCGMFQGPKSLKELNYRSFPFNPAEIDVVLLTHAHIDHSGLIPKLFKHGFRGEVLTTQPTCDLLTYMLPDSGYIQEMEVDRLNSRRHRHGEETVMPIYTRQDAERCLKILSPISLGDWLEVMPKVRARYWPAGHILGAASIEMEIEQGGTTISLLFSGDIGTADRALHGKPESPAGIDYLICESTYGDKPRGVVTAETRRETLREEVRAALGRGGVLIIPAFAIERTQELLFDLGLLVQQNEIPRVPIFLDSPLAVNATGVFRDHVAELGVAAGMKHPFDGPQVHFVETPEQSKKLNEIEKGAIIMAASGMCDAGRVRHHLLNHLWRQQSTVLLVGYQAPGTLGRLLLDGAPAVRIFGQEIQVRAKIRAIDIYSAHADQAELLHWIEDRQPIRQAILLTHGEPVASATLASLLADHLSAPLPKILLPTLGNRLTLDPSRPAKLEPGIPLIETPALAETDWHNLRSRFQLELSEALRLAPDDAVRLQMLRDLSERLERRRPAPSPGRRSGDVRE
jgi:metallo-beta-lactamase family protein